jgi:thioredoxin 1
MKSTVQNTFKTDVVDSKKVVLLDVWAPWCGPCRGMEPILESVAEETKDWAEVVKLDASVEADQAQELGVTALPTFLIFKDGQIVESAIGATPKARLLELLNKAR